MKDQKNLIKRGNWDNLIVLDACRFDYFKKIYNEYLNGDLKKVRSPVDTKKSFATTDWCKKIFENGNFEEVLYFSSTPRVNSKTGVDGFNASDEFSEIIDLWNTDWNEEYGTVMPKEVTNSVKRRLKVSNPEKTVVHYLQPHCPYISYSPPLNIKNNSPEARKKIKNQLMIILGPKVRDTLGPKNFLKLTDILGIDPIDHLQEVLRYEGEQELKKVYKQNLRDVLKEVSNLTTNLDGKTVVTSDHGEYLEKELYGHSFVPQGKAVKEVPWFEVESTKT